MLPDLPPRARRTSFLQLEASPLVGRRRELAELGRAMAASRLVTLVGEPGVGKTRLALRFAVAQRSDYESVWFCDLRDARDNDAMSAALARTLSIADEGTIFGAGDAATTAVGRALAARGRTLLVLDNAEQLLPGGAAVVLGWLNLARDARFVVTSREPLYLLGEELLELGPLPVPAGPSATGDAVALFVDRVRGLRHGFVPSSEESRAIADMVRRVRGVPLAVELCASQFSTGAVHEGRLLALRGGLSGEPPFNHGGSAPRPSVYAGGSTYADPIAWSFRKLDRLEREALAQCSVFRGSFTFEAAERVVELPFHDGAVASWRPKRVSTMGPPAEPFHDGAVASWRPKRVSTMGPPAEPFHDTAKPDRTRSVLAVLLQKSLIQPVRTGHEGGGARFTVCEGIRAYAARLLHEGVEASGAPWRHAQHYLDLASGPLTDLPSMGAPVDTRPPGSRPSPTNRAELAAERDNLEAVLDFGAAQGRREIVLRAAVALDVLSSGTGLSRAHLARLDDALQSSTASLDPAMVGRALGVRAAALRALGRLEEAERDARTALGLARRAGSTRQIVAMHLAVGGARFQMGDLEQALAHSRAGAEAARTGGHPADESLGLQQVGSVLQAMGESAEARAHYEAALQLALESDDEVAEARAAMGLGSYHLEAGDLERAESYYDRALLIARRRGMQRNVRIVTGYLGVLRFDAGRLQEAERSLDNAVKSSRSVGDLRVEGIFEGIRGAVLASLDLVDEARSAFALAHQLLGSNPYFRAVIELHQGHLDLAEARELRAEGGADHAGTRAHAAVRRLAEAEAWHGDTAPLVQRSDDARIASRILRRAITKS